MSRTPIPALLSFASFRLDVLLSMDASVRTHPVAVAKAKALQATTGTYVVYISDRDGIFQHHSPYNVCYAYFLQPGTPQDDLTIGVDAAMSIPIGATKEPHVSGRKPLQPTSQLPWGAECYTMEAWFMPLRGPTMYESDDNVTHELPISEAIRHSSYVREDYAARRRRRQLDVPGAVAAQDATPGEGDSADSDADASADGSGDTGSIPSTSNDTDYTPDDDVKLVAQHLFMPCDIDEINMMTGTFSHDISRISKLRSPELFREEMTAIYRLEREVHALVVAEAEASCHG
ncbi:hypothetical protein HMN09_00466600 [Mycena chlorophos]|uniref:Uncharacterized protein n=1 Tax=Mycena chlorophos TaxID=658473 RepID=A0A8H6WHS7_MYCCL|nr:hypothetical protein HMN09_00466600 [Mycena chlorophos]